MRGLALGAGPAHYAVMDERMGRKAWQERYAHPCAWEQEFPPLAMTEMFANSVNAHGNRPLVDFMGRRYSYNEIAHDARRFAAGLQSIGLERGDRVGLYLPNVPHYLTAYFGILMAGMTVVNFSPLYTAAELERQVADSGTRLLVTLDVPALLPVATEVLRDSSLERLVVARLARMLPFAKGLAMRILRRGDLSTVPNAPNVIDWSDFLLDDEPEPVEIDPLNDIALLQYSGGTTGVPKGAMITHQNLTANARQIVAIDPHRGERDMIVGVLPLFHVFANASVLDRTVLNGGCIAMLPRFNAAQTLDTISRTQATALPGVPTMYQALLDHPAMARTDFSSLRICISGGAPLAEPLRAQFEQASGARLAEGYGLTETSGVVSTNPFGAAGRAGTIGHPLPATDLLLLDKENPARVAIEGEVGELAVRGPQVMAGYWNRPDAAASVFARIDGQTWLRTGDIAKIDEDGFISIVDRIKDMIAVGGFKVFPSQVEAVLLEHPAVRQALVIGVPEAYHGEVPRAYATLKPGTNAATEELTEWLNERLGKHERVDRVIVRDSLPMTLVGKPDRKALRAEVEGEAATRAA